MMTPTNASVVYEDVGDDDDDDDDDDLDFIKPSATGIG